MNNFNMSKLRSSIRLVRQSNALSLRKAQLTSLKLTLFRNKNIPRGLKPNRNLATQEQLIQNSKVRSSVGHAHQLNDPELKNSYLKLN